MATGLPPSRIMVEGVLQPSVFPVSHHGVGPQYDDPSEPMFHRFSGQTKPFADQ